MEKQYSYMDAFFEIYLQNEDDKAFEKFSELLTKAGVEWELSKPNIDHFEPVASIDKLFKIKRKNRKAIWKMAKAMVVGVTSGVIVNSIAAYQNQPPMQCVVINKNENTITIVDDEQREDFNLSEPQKTIEAIERICEAKVDVKEFVLRDLNDITDEIKGYETIKVTYRSVQYTALFNGVEMKDNQVMLINKGQNVITVPNKNFKSAFIIKVELK